MSLSHDRCYWHLKSYSPVITVRISLYFSYTCRKFFAFNVEYKDELTQHSRSWADVSSESICRYEKQQRKHIIWKTGLPRTVVSHQRSSSNALFQVKERLIRFSTFVRLKLVLLGSFCYFAQSYVQLVSDKIRWANCSKTISKNVFTDVLTKYWDLRVMRNLTKRVDRHYIPEQNVLRTVPTIEGIWNNSRKPLSRLEIILYSTRIVYLMQQGNCSFLRNIFTSLIFLNLLLYFERDSPRLALEGSAIKYYFRECSVII